MHLSTHLPVVEEDTCLPLEEEEEEEEEEEVMVEWRGGEEVEDAPA
jgi:hypothetical protein